MTMTAEPDYEPRSLARSEETKRRHRQTLAERTAARVENVEFLLSWQATVWEIPGRVGHASPAALEKFLYRQGRGDLVAEMRRRDPLTMNRYARKVVTGDLYEEAA